MSRAGAAYEIACDESGFSGGNLVGPGHSPVFVHASVRLDPGTAESVVGHIRRSIGAKSGEYKAAELLRPRHRAVLRWFLDAAGPLAGSSRVHLVDTRFFVLARAVDVLLGQRPVLGTDTPGQDPALREHALTLYRSGELAYGTQRWQAFLVSAANVLRTNNRWLPKRPIAIFGNALDSLEGGGSSGSSGSGGSTGSVGEVIARLRTSRSAAEQTRTELLSDRLRTPLMEPLIPAVLRTVELWGETMTSISLVHDEQSALTQGRIAEIADRFAARRPGRELTGVQLVDSRADARIQVADFLAGIAARLAGDQLRGRPDPELTALLVPAVDPRSVWTTPFK